MADHAALMDALLDFLRQNDNDVLDEEAAHPLWVAISGHDSAPGETAELDIYLQDTDRATVATYRLTLAEVTS